MPSIPAADLAHEILDACLRDGTWQSRALDALIERALDETDPFTAQAATRAFFGIVIERLADLFEPQLCDVYARLFSHVIARTLPDYNASELLIRYRNVRQVRPFAGGQIDRVYVLSRVTLGADVAITSVFMQAAKQRFPDAEIALVGPDKNAGLFAADPQVQHFPVVYSRSTLLRDRLMAALELQTLVDETGTIVIDPDSRLTQLGLIPVCDDSRYYFFESRGYGGEFDDALPQLASQWAHEVFDVADAHAYCAPEPQPHIADITISVGVGENTNKRMDDAFEREVVAALLARNGKVLIDRGAGGEEADRVNAIAGDLGNPPTLLLHDGSYASFASHILQSKLYVGYDSAGQHVACSGNIPLVSVFAGYASDRMFQRWRPVAPRSRVVRVGEEDRHETVARTLKAISEAAAEA